MARIVQVPPEILAKWQELVDVIAEIIQVPSALIMRVEPPNIEVFVRSGSKGNPYHPQESACLDTRLYCETVIRTRKPLLVPDALQDPGRSSNPDIKVGMISYFGFPISWPDGEIFGTICVLDNKRNEYSDVYRKFLRHTQNVLQADLRSLLALCPELEQGQTKMRRLVDARIVRAEADAREAERRYREVHMELEHASRLATMGQLTASIAHEVSQPIAGALTNAHAALRWLNAQQPDLGEVRQALERIVRDGTRAGDVIGRIRGLIRKAPPRKEAMEINPAICEVIGLTRAEATKSNVAVRTKLAEDLPLLQADRVQLQQVMLNLIVNAVEAMSVSQGSRELLVSTEKTEWGGVLVCVRDTGPGLALANVEHVFDAFYTTKPAGMGIGLSICRSIVETHGGRLWAAANMPRGALFQFTIPAS